MLLEGLSFLLRVIHFLECSFLFLFFRLLVCDNLKLGQIIAVFVHNIKLAERGWITALLRLLFGFASLSLSTLSVAVDDSELMAEILGCLAVYHDQGLCGRRNILVDSLKNVPDLVAGDVGEHLEKVIQLFLALLFPRLAVVHQTLLHRFRVVVLFPRRIHLFGFVSFVPLPATEKTISATACPSQRSFSSDRRSEAGLRSETRAV